MSKILYHKNCPDGSGAALAVWTKLGDEGNEYIEVQYGNPYPENLDNEDVIIVDFSYPKDILYELAKKCKSILILDHHKSAMKDLEEFNEPNVEIIFNMDKSGSVLAWEYFNKDTHLPMLFSYLQDYDLWKHNFKASKSIWIALKAKTNWRDWIYYIDHETELAGLTEIGDAINSYLEIEQNKIIKGEPQLFPITGDTVPYYNLLSFMTNDTLCKALEKYPDAPFGVSFVDLIKEQKRTFSLRSRSEGLLYDVSTIAVKHGGGGHKSAAAFSLTFEELKKYQ